MTPMHWRFDQKGQSNYSEENLTINFYSYHGLRVKYIGHKNIIQTNHHEYDPNPQYIAHLCSQQLIQ